MRMGRRSTHGRTQYPSSQPLFSWSQFKDKNLSLFLVSDLKKIEKYYRAIAGSQQNEVESTEIFPIPSAPRHAQSPPLSIPNTGWYICYNRETDTSLSQTP